MKRLLVPVFLASLLCWGVAPAFGQQPKYLGIRGTLTNAASAPLAGHRVVFVPAGSGQSFLSQPTRPDGTFIISLPEGSEVVPVAVVDPRGIRIELADEASLIVAEGVRRDIQLPATADAPSTPQSGAGTVDVTGVIRNPEGGALVGYRVVFRSEGGYEVQVSGPSDSEGEYSVRLPVRGLFVPVAIIDARGHRRTIDDDNPVQANAGATRDVTYTSSPNAKPLPEPTFPGADRLFISFAEDVPVVDDYRGEFRLDFGEFDGYDIVTGKAVIAGQVPALPDVELGASFGYGDSNPNGPTSSETGLTDLQLWGKLRAGPRASGTDWGFGFVVNLPTGEEQPGLGADSLSTKLFYSERRSVGWAVLSYHVGVEVNQDGRVGAVKLDGQVAPTGGVALIFAPGERYSVVAELFASGERFDGLGEDVRLLGGVNWKVGEAIHVRGALTIGLSDGAPDVGLTAGVVFEY